METLLNVIKVKNFDDTIALEKLNNDVGTCVRNVKTLNVEAVTYGYLFIPILKARLPDALVMIIGYLDPGSSFKIFSWRIDS